MSPVAKISPNQFAEWINSLGGGDDGPAYAPELDDLYFLYCFVRDHSIVSVLEFGSGWSSVAFARGLMENDESFGESYRAQVRHPNPFRLLTVDASEKWSKRAQERVPLEMQSLVTFHLSSVAVAQDGASDFGVRHHYESLPFFIPDLVYLDGPDSDQVRPVNDFELFVQPHSLPMSGDLLRMEPQLWPGTYVITDGRLGNARFLRDRLRSRWEFLTDHFADRVLMRLAEETLGEVGEKHIGLRLAHARELRAKEAPLVAL